jgi:tape measure domain-containing protein
MANTTRRDVELRINANDLSEKTLQQLLDTFDKLRASQEALAKSGDGTQRSVRELKQDLTDLQAVATELKGRAALVDQFLAIEKRATEAATRVESAKEALKRFNAAQAEGAELTKKEQTEFARLSREVLKTEKSLTTSTAKLQEFRAALSQIGAGDTAHTRDALLKFSTDLGASLATAEQSIRRYDEALRANAAKEDTATKAKRQAAIAAAELKTAQDALATSVGFNTQGRDALKAASNVEVLTRDYDKLAATSRKAGDGIREILDPSRQALASLDALEAEVKRLNAQLDSVHAGPKLGEELKQIRADYNAFAADAGRAAASLVDDIGSYRKVDESLAALRTRIEGAQQAVREFAAQMAVASEPSDRLARDLAASQAKLKGFVGEFDREAQVLANLRGRLREAGVDVNHLADAEARLAGVAGGVVESQRKIEAVAVRVSQLAQATHDLKAAEEALAGGVAFNQLGRDALKAAGSIDALSRDYDALAATSRKAGDGIRGIIDPSRQALTSLDGLETQTQKLNEELQKAASSSKLRDEVRKLRSEYGSLATDAGKAATALADDIGSYRQAEQAVGSLRARVEDARQTVRNFAGQMAVAASPSDALAKSLTAAKGQLNSLVSDFDRQSTALAKLRIELREAGVNTDKLGEAEARLANVARGVVTAQEALGVAAVKVGGNTNKAGKELGLFDDHGRKALSTAQRLRGELLSLASAYLGLFAAINVAKGSVDAAVSREGILRRLELVEGSAEKATAKFDQLSATADRLGVNFEQSAKGFSDIAIGAKEAGLSTDDLDRFFVNLSTTTRGLALDGEKTGRVFTAVSQVFGKNKVQSEELTQQLGEHLPAVVAKAAKALNMEAGELQKNLEAGNLSVRALVVIFDEYAKHISTLSKQNSSAVDAITKFENAMYRLKLAIGDSGFLKSFTELLEDATKRLKAGEFDDAIKGLGNLFKIAAESAKFLLEHITAVEVAFVSLIALNVGKLVLGVAVSMKALGVSSGFAAGAVRLLGVAMTFLARNPIVALIVVLATLVVSTETGRAAIRALWQVVVEVGGAFGDLLGLDFAAFAARVKGSMDRVGAAFRGAKDEADGLAKAGEEDAKMDLAKRIQAKLAARGVKASIVDNRPAAAAAAGTDAATDPALVLEAKRRAEADLTKKTVEGIEKHMADVRKAAAKETAKAIHNIEGEVRAEYQDTQDKIDDLNKRAAKTGDAGTAAAAKALQVKFDKEIAIIVAAKKKQAAELAGKKFEKGGVADELEQAKQRAEVVKDGLRLEQAELEQSFKEGLVSLRDYYAKRLDETKRGLDAEIVSAREQIAILEKVRATDPTAAKKITKLEGDITGKVSEKELAERRFRLEAELAEKALRRQVDAVQQELDELTGDERQAGLRAIQNFYTDQLEKVNQLTGAEKERALQTLQTLVGLRSQLVEINAMRKAADQLNALRNAAIGAATSTGDLSHMQQLAAQSEANKLYLADLQKQAEQLRVVGQTGSDAYKAIQVEMVRLQGETDLLGNEITGTLKTAASSFVETLMQTKSPEKALKAFGKSLGGALSKALVDEASSAIVKWLKSSGGFDSIKSLFKMVGGFFSSGHTGAVIGHGGAVPKRVSPFAFIGAPRYHSGGLPGLRRDEVAFIGLKGEEVLSRNDPRNVMNAGKNPPGAAGGPLVVQLHPDAMHMTLRDWLQGELARVSATQ